MTAHFPQKELDAIFQLKRPLTEMTTGQTMAGEIIQALQKKKAKNKEGTKRKETKLRHLENTSNQLTVTFLLADV